MSTLRRRLVGFLVAAALLLAFVGLSIEAEAAKGKKHPHIHKAIHDLKATKAHLEKAPPEFKGHRSAAIKEVEKAIAQLHHALKVAK